MKQWIRPCGPIVIASLLAIAIATVCTAKPPKATLTVPKASSPAAMPANMVSFFVGLQQCPDGWELFQEHGFMIVATADPGSVGETVAAPMNPKAAPTHDHSISFKVSLSSKSIVAANGGSNTDGAAHGTYTGSASASGSSNLPFYDFLTCEFTGGSGQ
ncbi:MAG TPA: hypothetical protein VMH80_26955 [Bryobacteraceae bacterium]|nr:hypothetical protein [Bryobacteraceae bacterium]